MSGRRVALVHPLRTHADYAIEFGEYLARSAEGYVAARGREAKTDALRVLRSAIYEFRKRASRAKAVLR